MARGPRIAWSERRAQVDELLKRHELGKVSFKQLAHEAGYPLPTLYSWIQRLRREGEESAVANGDSRPRFVELAAAGNGEDSGGGIELVLASGMRVQLASSFDGATLKRLLLLLSA